LIKLPDLPIFTGISICPCKQLLLRIININALILQQPIYPDFEKESYCCITRL
jgi:hypothetical protein